MEEYIILTNKNYRSMKPKSTRSWNKTGFDAGFSFDDFEAATTAAEVPEPVVETRTLDENQAHEAAGDPSVAAIALNMPTILIEPMADGPAAVATDEAWGIASVGADTSPFTGAGVTVAVLDTGIDTDHPAFNGVNVETKDFSGDGIEDFNGHGTHCAGTVFGRDVDGTRIGIARGVTHALIGKVLRNNGTGGSNMAFEGIKWAASSGANVISMSLGFDFPGFVKKRVDAGWPADLATSNALVAFRANLLMFDRIMKMLDTQVMLGEGAVVVAASGNESRVQNGKKIQIAASLPAAAEGVISVGALYKDHDKYATAEFSNIMPRVSAPGVAIKSAKAGGGLVDMNGTSMACPHVAGLAALWWEALRKRAPDGRTRADNVAANLIASVRHDVFVAGLKPSDYGAGIPTAPTA